jgi:sugar/nucleoside kinase (ribokinase family)
MQTLDVVSVCSALMDVVVTVSEAELQALPLRKGYSHLLETAQQQEILEKVKHREFAYELGGSCLNAVRALALLGKKTVFAGAVGEDAFGEKIRLRTDMLQIAAQLSLQPGHATGCCVVLVTPDGERTMMASLGASSLVGQGDVPTLALQNTRFFHCSGYSWLAPSLRGAVRQAILVAKTHGSKISIDISDPCVANLVRDDMLAVIEEDADIVFANEEEANLLFPGSPEFAAQALADRGILAVIKLGAKGALLQQGAERYFVSPESVMVVDTTAAGDMFAAGVLYGLLMERGLKTAGQMGSLLAADVIGRYGATLSEQALMRVRTL